MQSEIMPVFSSCTLRQLFVVEPPGKQNVNKNFRKIAGGFRTVRNLVLYAEHVPLHI